MRIWDFLSLSRSDAAASKLEEASLKNIACITSGLQTVKPGLVIISLVFRS